MLTFIVDHYAITQCNIKIMCDQPIKTLSLDDLILNSWNFKMAIPNKS